MLWLCVQLKSPSFLGNEELSPWLKLRDCSQVSDGGAGLILCSEEGLAKLGTLMCRS
jgi:hypothetical protein